MTDQIVTINAGSSSIKFGLFGVTGDDVALGFSGLVEGIGTAPHFRAESPEGEILDERRWDADGNDHAAMMRFVFDWVDGRTGDDRILAAGHRVAHGGYHYRQPCRVDDSMLAAVEALSPLAPLHNPHNIAPIKSLRRDRPDLIQVACFDTAFHTTKDPLDKMFALPRSLFEEGVRRYGFHGLSYEFIAGELPRYDARAAQGHTAVAHLGNGASLCGLRGGRSATCTMGFSALDGLMMGTRCGSLDAGVILHLMLQKGMDVQAVQDLLYKESGLKGVSGISNDMRDLLKSDLPHAREAVDLFIYRIVREIGSTAAALGGLDALVFTGGIGEHSAEIRAGVCAQLGWLGVDFDPVANRSGAPRISTADSKVSVWVIPTNEELMIARHTLALAREAEAAARQRA